MKLGDFGQPRLERLLDDMLARGRVTGSFLFDGPPGVGKEALAIELGRLLDCENEGRCPPRPLFAPAGAKRAAAGAGPPARGVASRRAASAGDAARGGIAPARQPSRSCDSCRKFERLQHPDLCLVFPVPSGYWDEESETIQKILEAKAADPYHKPEFDRPAGIQAEVLRDRVLPVVQRRPVEARSKVVVLSDAEQMAPGIGNLILKTLEEPPADCLIVLTTAAPDRLLPTIRSRCQRLRFGPLAAGWMEPRLQLLYAATPAQARLAASLARGSMRAAARSVTGDFQEVRDRAFAVLEAAAACDLLKLLEMSEAIARESTSKEERRRHVPALVLQMVAVAARDALLVAEGAAAGRGAQGAGISLVNADRASELQSLARAYAPEILRDVVRRAESTERELAGYANTELALASLFLGLARDSDRARALGARA